MPRKVEEKRIELLLLQSRHQREHIARCSRYPCATTIVGAPRCPGKNQPSRVDPSISGNENVVGWPIMTVKSKEVGVRAGRIIW